MLDSSNVTENASRATIQHRPTIRCVATSCLCLRPCFLGCHAAMGKPGTLSFAIAAPRHCQSVRVLVVPGRPPINASTVAGGPQRPWQVILLGLPLATVPWAHLWSFAAPSAGGLRTILCRRVATQRPCPADARWRRARNSSATGGATAEGAPTANECMHHGGSSTKLKRGGCSCPAVVPPLLPQHPWVAVATAVAWMACAMAAAAPVPPQQGCQLRGNRRETLAPMPLLPRQQQHGPNPAPELAPHSDGQCPEFLGQAVPAPLLWPRPGLVR